MKKAIIGIVIALFIIGGFVFGVKNEDKIFTTKTTTTYENAETVYMKPIFEITLK